jgi:Flp pilus assembly protein TadG
MFDNHGDTLMMRLRRFRRARDGAVSPIMALFLIPLIGMIGLAAETGGWYFTQRAAQNAADTSALAAARAGPTYYDQTARATALKYNFQQGVNNATVAPQYPVTCPDGDVSCYKVTITKILPIALTRAVGFNGSDAVGGGRGQKITASAVAKSRIFKDYCVMALATSGNAITMNGNQTLGGCDIYSNAGAKCNGTSFGVNTASVVSNSATDCGSVANYSNATPITDTFAGLSTAGNIPTTTTGCGSGTAPAGNLTKTCWNGDLKLSAGVTTIPAGTTLRIVNGNVIFNGGTLKGEGVTIVFTGPAGNNKAGFFSGSGTLDMSAPTSGTWSGVAVYQDTRMTKAGDFTYSGNTPAFLIQGLIYGKYLDLDFRGAINKHTGGYSCIGVMVRTLTVSGGALFGNTTSECRQAGLTLPDSQAVLTRQALVQ